jgi:hypothetical protein
MRHLLSQINLYDDGNLKGFGPLGLQDGGDPGEIFNKFLSNAIGLITIIAFIWFMFLVIIGAIGIMGAGGDKNAVSSNAKKITNGLIGLVVLISSLALIQLVGTLFGIKDIILNPADALLNLVF